MSNIPQKWFTNARPLTLDSNGRVDFSLKHESSDSNSLIDPTKFERFRGWPIRQIKFPQEEKIILTYCWNGSEPTQSLHDVNHNIFRLNARGEVVWQVGRDDSIRKPDWWDLLHADARAKGEDGAREPFMEFVLKYPDGSDNLNPNNGCPPDEAVWTPDCTIWLRGSAYQQYILDPETGIAKNVTIGRPRPW